MKTLLIQEYKWITSERTEYEEIDRRVYRWRWRAKMRAVDGLVRSPLGWIAYRSRLEDVE